MKRILILVFTALMMLTLLVSCRGVLEKSKYKDEPVLSGVTMETQFPVYHWDVEKIQVTIKNNTGSTLEFGAEWALEVKNNNKWYSVPFVENVGWNSLLYTLADGGTHTFTVHTNMLDYEIVGEDYRVVKAFSSGIAIAEFQFGKSNVSDDSPYGYIPLEKLPADYSIEAAIADGCIAPGAENEGDREIIKRFFESTQNGCDGQLRLCEQTDKGLVLSDIIVEHRLGVKRYLLKTDSTRAGGDTASAYYGFAVAVLDRLLFVNTLVGNTEQAEVYHNIYWQEFAPSYDSLKPREDTDSQAARHGVFWSPDGMRVVTLTDEPLEFGVSRLYEGGGESGSLNSISGADGMTEIVNAVWQSDPAVILFICETEVPDTVGYVFYDTDKYKTVNTQLHSTK